MSLLSNRNAFTEICIFRQTMTFGPSHALVKQQLIHGWYGVFRLEANVTKRAYCLKTDNVVVYFKKSDESRHGILCHWAEPSQYNQGGLHISDVCIFEHFNENRDHSLCVLTLIWKKTLKAKGRALPVAIIFVLERLDQGRTTSIVFYSFCTLFLTVMRLLYIPVTTPIMPKTKMPRTIRAIIPTDMMVTSYCPYLD
jgi:hypothetical protein